MCPKTDTDVLELSKKGAMKSTLRSIQQESEAGRSLEWCNREAWQTGQQKL